MADVFKAVLDISLAASALALLALAARLVIGRRPNAVLPLLSLLVILRLAIPAAMPSPLSVMNLLQYIRIEQPAPEAASVNETSGNGLIQTAVNSALNPAVNPTVNPTLDPAVYPAEENPISESETNPGTNAVGSYAAADEPALKAPSFMDVASIIWVIGMAAMAACIAASNIRFSLTLKKNRRYEMSGFRELLEQCKQEMGISRRIEAVQLSGINTAAVYGVFRPKLLISPSFGWLSEQEKKHVLLHELSHIKRCDTLVCLLITALTAVYWFNPVLWIALALARRDMEVMCDMAVLKLTQDKRSYASTLFSLAKASGNSRPKLVTALFIGPQNALRFGVLISTDSIKRRMKMITRYKRSRLFTAVSIILVLAIAITGCTGAVNAPEFTPPETTEGQVLVSSYSLDYSAISNDKARTSNIEKAAASFKDMYTVESSYDEGTSGYTSDDSIISVMLSMGPIGEKEGWQTAPWISWDKLDKLEGWVSSGGTGSGGHAERIEDLDVDIINAETTMRAGGGIDIVFITLLKAASLAGGKVVDYPMPPDEDNICKISFTDCSLMTFKIRTENNIITAEFYAPAGTAAGFTPSEIEGQELIGAYMLDIGTLPEDAARKANIEKAAGMLNGTVFPAPDETQTNNDLKYKWLDLDNSLGEITETNGWHSAPAIGLEAIEKAEDCRMIYDSKTGITTNKDPQAFNSEILGAETTNKVGGGAEIVMFAVWKATTLAWGLDNSNNFVENLNVGASNIMYTKDVTLKVWVQDNKIFAAFYMPAGTAAGFPPSEIEGQKLISAYILDISALPEDAARQANIEKAAGMSNGYVFPAADDAWVELDLELTESGGWRSAPALEQEVIDKAYKWTLICDPNTWINTNKDQDKFNNEVFGVRTANKVGGGAELVILAVQRAISAVGMDHSDGVSFYSLGFGGMNNYEKDLTLKVQVQNKKIIAAFYSKETAEPATTPIIDPDDAMPTIDPNDWRQKFQGKFSDTVEQTANSYKDANIDITIEKVQKDGATYFIADIYVKELKYFRSAFPENASKMGGRESTDKIAKEVGAILAINGDNCVNITGTVVRNGQMYREKKSSADVLVMNYDGSMQTYSPEEFDAEKIKTESPYQVWSFGPMLLKDGKPMTEFNSKVGVKNPRTAVGYYEPGHYCFVVVDGRQPGYSDGLTLTQLSQLFADLGCTVAYNMDGGQSSEMAFMGKLINQPNNGGRSTADIIYIGE